MQHYSPYPSSLPHQESARKERVHKSLSLLLLSWIPEQYTFLALWHYLQLNLPCPACLGFLTETELSRLSAAEFPIPIH